MSESSDFDAAVRSAVDRLPFVLAQSVWLVDICGCSYEVAAANAGTSSHEMGHRIRLARRRIADRVCPRRRNLP